MTEPMHDDEVTITDDLVRRLLSAQHPHLAGRPLRRVRSTGTVNAIVRLGDDLYVRLPRVAAWAGDLDKELEWLPHLGPSLSLEVPEPVAVGEPTDEFPSRWAVFRWIDGSPYAVGDVDEASAAAAMGAFVEGLRAVPLAETAPAGGRRPLAEVDTDTRSALRRSGGHIDVEAALAAWDRGMDAPSFDGASPVWLHGDLLPPNVLVRDSRLAAVLDFGSVGVGDPAADTIAAWTMFGERGRAAYREALGVDEGTWERARGYALTQAAMIIPYYERTNPAFTAMARTTVANVVADVARGVGAGR